MSKLYDRVKELYQAMKTRNEVDGIVILGEFQSLAHEVRHSFRYVLYASRGISICVLSFDILQILILIFFRKGYTH